MSASIIHCVIDVFAKPQSTEKVRTALLTILEPTRKEDGCLKYKLFQNMADHCQFTLIGAWEHEDAFEDHLQSDHYRKVDSDIKNDVVKTTNVKRYKYIQNDPSKAGDTKTSGFCILI
jgi:quinol monooxygenase YgiN